ncbi:F-box/LRR-repeat protein At3g03360-like isoform X3 [Solanum lycopersicum]|uniref:F-box/LRR-repeat protein At3g03360-like isoform X3 n=1 Tax=Solanum lycopersicum TaxID=4081 RepID=UPI000532DB6A|nr:uncharacterized protein LOC101259278 isoform X3 [Solanum lycopersicum]
MAVSLDVCSSTVSLHVRFPNREKHVVDYLNSIRRDLHYWRCCHKIRKFSVFYDTCDPQRVAKDVDLCFYFASKLANVEHFQFISDGGYVFPQFAYKNTSWRKLDIESCMELKPLADVKWSGIVSLSIGCTYLTDGSMEKILSGCPNLECLQLDHFWGFHRLEISNVKSRELIIDNLETDECDVWLDIIAPYIQNLKILESCRGIYLRNVASLVTVVFNFEFEEEEPLQRKESTCLKELFQSVAHVEKLELGPWCIQYLSIMELEGWQPPPSSWKFLQLHVHLKQLDFPGICCFLQSSSDLETLVIDGTCC